MLSARTIDFFVLRRQLSPEFIPVWYGTFRGAQQLPGHVGSGITAAAALWTLFSHGADQH